MPKIAWLHIISPALNEEQTLAALKVHHITCRQCPETPKNVQAALKHEKENGHTALVWVEDGNSYQLIAEHPELLLAGEG